MNLNECSIQGLYFVEKEKDYSEFKTIGFDPEEILQLVEMNNKGLIGLMIYCGIRVYKGVPLCVMTDDEMRMAYLAWRYMLIQEKKAETEPKIRRMLVWADRLNRMIGD